MQSGRRSALITLASLPLAFAAPQSFAQTSAFDQIVSEVRADALARGVRPATVERALRNIQPLTVEHLETNQPERTPTVTFATYYGRHVTASTLNNARVFRQTYKTILDKAERDSGVPAAVILSILNIESRFGQNIGDQKIIPAFLTLVRDVKGDTKRARDRRAMFREEAVQAMIMIDEGYEEILTGHGSWAGAVGPGQFMPSSMRRYAVDGDGDGKKDMWRNYNDIIPSIANYLKQKGWHSDQRWGRKIDLPAGFDKNLMTDTLLDQTNKTANEWSTLGVKLSGGAPLPNDTSLQAMLIAPNYNVKEGGLKGPYYMVYDNFRTVMQYNKSYKYALTVLQMADAIDATRVVPYVAASPSAPYNQ